MKNIFTILLLFITLYSFSQDYRNVDWKTIPTNIQLLGIDTFKFDADPIDYNDVGVGQKDSGYYFIDFIARAFLVIGYDATTITVVDLAHENTAPNEGQVGRVYQSIVDGDTLFHSIGGVDVSVIDELSRWKDVARNNELFGRAINGADSIIVRNDSLLLENGKGVPITDIVDAENIGDGKGLYKETVSQVLRFKTLSGGGAVTIEEIGDSLVISTGPAVGEANTASDGGVGGIGLTLAKSGVDLPFKNINSGSSKISITDDLTNDEVDIDIVPGNINTSELNNDAGFLTDYQDLINGGKVGNNQLINISNGVGISIDVSDLDNDITNELQTLQEVAATGNTSTIDLEVPTESYGVGWSGSLEVATKADLYTKIEAIASATTQDLSDGGKVGVDQTINISGGGLPVTFSVADLDNSITNEIQNLQTVTDEGAITTIDISVPTEVYSASWSSSVEVPTKGDLYTKIETIGFSQPLDSVQLNPNADVSNFTPWAFKPDTANRTIAMTNDEEDIAMQLGQELWLEIKNGNGSTFQNGKVVYITGADQGKPTVELADNRNFTTADAIGMITHDVESETFGFTTTFGLVRGIDATLETPGDIVYVDTAGYWTTTRPVFADYEFEIGVIASDSSIFINPKGQLDDILHNINNGNAIQPFDFRTYSDGVNTYGVLTRSDADTVLTMRWSTGFYDHVVPDTILLTAGTDQIPQTNYVYIPESTKILTVSTSYFPINTEYKTISKAKLQSSATTQTKEALGNQNYNDFVASTSSLRGRIPQVGNWQRLRPAKWISGVQGSAAVLPNAAGPDTVYVTITSGIISQANEQIFPGLQMPTDDIHVPNYLGNNWMTVTDLSDLLVDATGTTMANSSFKYVIYVIQNKTGEMSHAVVNLPNGSYGSAAEAISDPLRLAVYDIPYDMQGYCIYSVELVFTHTNPSGGTWTLVDTKDITTLSVGSGGSSTVGGTGIQALTQATDYPNSYIGQGNKLVKVGSSETATEFSLGTISDAGTINIPTGQAYQINGTALAASDITNAFDKLTDDTDVVPEGVANLYYTEGRVSANTDVAANTAARHDAITIGTPANGLSLSVQEISLGLSSTSTTGALSNTDWNLFDGKEDVLTFSTGLTRSVNTITTNDSEIDHNALLNYTITEHRTINDVGIAVTDLWSGNKINIELSGKEPTLSKANLTEATSSVLTITGGTGAVIGSGTSIQVKLAGISQNGYLSSTDWNTFNDKLSSEVDGSITNEGSLTVGAGTGTTSLIQSNTSGSTDVTIAVAGINTIGEVGNTITITGTEVDGDITNEGSLTVAAGTATTSIINSNTSGQTGVTLTASGINAISEVGNVITLTATEVDGVIGNEYQDLTWDAVNGHIDIDNGTNADVGGFSTTSTNYGFAPGSNNLGATYYLDGSGSWSVPPGGGSASFDVDINQTTHGFSVDDAIYHNGTIFAKALGDAIATSEVIGVVTAVADVNNFTYTYGGLISGTWTNGTAYFLSNTAAGSVVVEPTYNVNDVRQYIGMGTPDGLLLEIDLGDVITAVSFGGGDVTKVGTPVDNQVGVWTGDGTIEGTTSLTFGGGTLDVNGIIDATSSVIGSDLQTETSVLFTETTSGAAPGATQGFLFMDQADDKIKFRNSTTIYDLTAGDGDWSSDANGINYQAGNVGIGTSSSATTKTLIDGGSETGLQINSASTTNYTVGITQNGTGSAGGLSILSNSQSTLTKGLSVALTSSAGSQSAALYATNPSTYAGLHIGVWVQAMAGSDGVGVYSQGQAIDFKAANSGIIETKEISSASTSNSGYGSWYFKTDGKPYAKDDIGTEYDLTAGASLPKSTKSITIGSPTASEDIAMFYVPEAMTISNIYAVVKGTTPSVTINPVQTTDRSAAGTAILSSATAITNTTGGQNLTSFNDATVPSGSWIVFKTTAQSGTVDEVTVTIVYDVD